MIFNSLNSNQEAVVRLIKNSFDKERLFHIYLFSGPRGSLKMDAALYLANLVLCDNGGMCGECAECKALDRFSNPHLFIVKPDGEAIKKEQVEDLEHEFAYASDHVRMFIIQDIDKATLSAANTLLKFLEDLPNNCYGVLTTEAINKVIPTIRSRSQIVTFNPISSDVVSSSLISKGIEEEKAKVISKITNNLSLAIKYTKDAFLEKAINLVKTISDKIEESDNGYLEFVKNSQFLYSADRDSNRIFLDMLAMIQSDKINWLINRKEKMVFTSLEYTNIVLHKDVELKILEIILKFRERVDSYANIDMIYTEMFVEIGKVFE